MAHVMVMPPMPVRQRERAGQSEGASQRDGGQLHDFSSIIRSEVNLDEQESFQGRSANRITISFLEPQQREELAIISDLPTCNDSAGSGSAIRSDLWTKGAADRSGNRAVNQAYSWMPAALPMLSVSLLIFASCFWAAHWLDERKLPKSFTENL
jgi:hypothetical protein